MGGKGSGGGKLSPDVIVRIGELHDEGLTGRAISRELGLSSDAVSSYIRIKKNDPKHWARLIIGAGAVSVAVPDDPILADLKYRLLNDWKWVAIHIRGLKIMPFHESAWRVGVDNQESLVELCRGCGKSELAQVRMIQRTLQSVEAAEMVKRGEIPPKEWNVNGSGVVISAAESQSERSVGVVKGFLESEPPQLIWGSFVGKPKWTNNQFYVRQRTRERSDPTLSALGVGSSKTTGLHPDDIYLDDVATYENSRTHGSRLKVRGWLANTLRGIAQPHTKIWWFNTPYHPEDVIESQRHRGIAIFVAPAIEKTKAGDEVSFWPEYFPMETGKRSFDGRQVIGLAQKRTEMEHDSPGSFDAQYLMDTAAIAERRIDMSMIKGIERSKLPADLLIGQFVDFAWTAKSRSDYTAIATIGYQRKTGNYYIIRVRRAKMKPSAIRQMVQNEFDEYEPSFVCAERTGLFHKQITTVMKELSSIPWKAITPRGDKETRALDFQDLLETGKLYAIKSEPWYDSFRAEGDVFPTPQVPDDQIDAACQLIIYLKRALGQSTMAPSMGSFMGQFAKK